MAWQKHDYDDIAGTYVFDGKHAHNAYALNKLFFSFNDAHNRQAFAQDPAAYCDRFALPDAHKRLVLEQDFLGILRAGANIYYMAKLAIPSGTSVQDTGAKFQGISTEAFIAKLLKKRDGLEERLKQEGGFWHG